MRKVFKELKPIVRLPRQNCEKHSLVLQLLLTKSGMRVCVYIYTEDIQTYIYTSIYIYTYSEH